MKIYSKFKDYYDSVNIYGIDPKLTFKRKKQKLKYKELAIFIQNWIDNIIKESSFMCHDNEPGLYLIGFCGKLYVLSSNWVKKKLEIPLFTFHYSFADYKKNNKYNFTKNYWRGIGLEEFYKNYHNKNDQTIFDHFNTPIFVLNLERGKGFVHEDFREYTIILNPKLTDYNFQKCIDPYTASQELNMYLSNEMCQEVDTLNIEDKYRIQAKGFDKWSFRKHKSQNKKRKLKKSEKNT